MGSHLFFVSRPSGLSVGDSDALAFLSATSEQDDDAVVVLAKIDAVTGSKIDFVLVSTSDFPC